MGLIIYFNEDIRAYIFFKSIGQPYGTWTMLKDERDKMEKLQNLYASNDDTIVARSNKVLIEKFSDLFNKKEFESTHNLFSKEFQQKHSNLNNAKFLELIFNKIGTIDSCAIEEFNYSFSENQQFFDITMKSVADFKNAVGTIVVRMDMYDSVNIKINEIGFQIDSTKNKIEMFKKQTDEVFKLLANGDYKELNELATLEYFLSQNHDNFKTINEKFYKNKKAKLIQTFLKLKKENENSEISFVYQMNSEFLEMTLEIDEHENFRINKFGLMQ